VTQSECREVVNSREADGRESEISGSGIGEAGLVGNRQSGVGGELIVAYRLLVAYLAFAAIGVVHAATEGRVPLGLAVSHIALTIALALYVRRFPILESRGFPTPGFLGVVLLITIPVLYAELPYVLWTSRLHDGVVQHWEGLVFGASPAQTAAGASASTVLSEVLHAAYLSYYAIIYGPPLLLLVRGERLLFERTVAGLMAVFAVCFALFIVFPVAGPRYLWPAPTGVYDGPMRRAALWLLSAGSSKGSAFPSSHVAVATTQTLMTYRWNRRLGVVLGVLTVLLGAGAVYGGFHYGVDVLAGAAVGIVVAAVVPFTKP
jgi:membrane-associated phospholipid phosphatase